MFTTRRSSLYSNVTKKVTQARKGLGTNSVGLATELSLVSKLPQKVIPKKISVSRVIIHTTGGPSSRLEKKPMMNSWTRRALCDFEFRENLQAYIWNKSGKNKFRVKGKLFILSWSSWWLKMVTLSLLFITLRIVCFSCVK